MSRFVKTIMWANLAVIAVLAFVYPHLTISPGQLIPDHRELEQDCFACHTPILGARSGKCIECHTVKDIGIRTTKGKPIINPASKSPVPFHQKLVEQECIVCHSDHTGVMPFRKHQTFSHDLLEPETRDLCVSCHKKPADKLHEKASDTCTTCHAKDKWKPATFKHELLAKTELEQCFNCHKKPVDKLHEKASKKCGLCHITDKWEPATFKHELLPPNDLAQCFECHKKPADKIHDKASEKCGQCHKTDKWKPALFKHELLPRAELRQCKTCHAKQTPNDQRHRESSGRCGNCHYTDKWEPAKKSFGSSSTSNSIRNTAPVTDQNWWLKNGSDDDD